MRRKYKYLIINYGSDWTVDKSFQRITPTEKWKLWYKSRPSNKKELLWRRPKIESTAKHLTL